MSEQNTAELTFSAFQKALNTNRIDVAKGELNSDMLVYLDQPEGETRYTYALMASGTRVKALCVATVKESAVDNLSLEVEVATFHKFRQQGHATAVLEKALAELKNGLSRNSIDSFSITLNVDSDNVAGHAFCKKFADEVKDTDTGKSYFKKVS
ncbi:MULTISPECIES: N-acetyltransferase [Vibrio]|uniref:N-acetyltransferase domain-containing protein n=1 Tax=Vibrio halioticoli NBRC 102217 TaxID=1219072 RepID=V5F3Q8_9VIBR|nr:MULTISPECIES: N-acetyltransferase [Vibrio]MPW36591.1 N-acetyltransferase [Vibrio sp. B1Z05]GAD89819.1 hypothetical protein VHA01S_028_00180 [Vibrio halioticoli NBRC 102217]